MLLWQLSGERTLGPRAREVVAGAGELAFSVVSFAEIGVKAALGKLRVPDDFLSQVTGRGVRVLPLSPGHGLAVARLPLHHRDPFDRLLVAQAAAEGLTLMSADARLPAYGVPVLDPLT